MSNGDLTSLELPPEKNDTGRVVGTLSVINLKSQATLFPVSGDQVAIYGAQSDSEGDIYCFVYNFRKKISIVN